MLTFFLAVLLTLTLSNGNTYCWQDFTGKNVVRFQGKLNVPIKPAHEPNQVHFYWPGVNPYSGLMQPVLLYGRNYGQGNGVWGFQNWYCNCPGYCQDKALPVVEGDTILFDVRKKSNGQWQMNWKSYNHPQLQSTFDLDPYPSPGSEAKIIWATEAEFRLDPADPNNWNKMPLSNFYTWDLVATTQNGYGAPENWITQVDDPHGHHANCNYDVTNNNVRFLGTELSVPPYNNGCTQPGFSRNFNYGCQSYCGCVNSDGTPKIICDYCCSSDTGACQRNTGPSYTFDELVEWGLVRNDTKIQNANESLPIPGHFL